MDKEYNLPEFENLWNGPHVELPAMLAAREHRVQRQAELINKYKKPLLCFTMNIAGPIKNNELIKRGFDIGINEFRAQMARTKTAIIFEEIKHQETGNEAWFVVDTDPLKLKRLTCEIEDKDDLGRLYDMDVIYPGASGNMIKIDRQEVGGSPRRCLICNAPGKDCSSRRLHSVSQLQNKSSQILYTAVMAHEAGEIAEFATRALLYEVSTTPKPGLVDRANSGSHKDMDFFIFMNSCAALWPYFEECALIGQKTAQEDPSATFKALRQPGKFAENRMLKATSGVNTHKGAIFTMGIICAAAGRLSAGSVLGTCSPIQRKNPQAILDECAKTTKGLVETDFAGINKNNAQTVGEKLFAEHAITGIRGQIEAGLPAVRDFGLPLLEKLIKEGKSNDRAGAMVLLSMISHTTDTTLIHRSSIARQQKAAQEAQRLLSESADKSVLEELDRAYIKENLSPGGSADLLAVCWFLHFIKEQGDE